MKTLIPGQFLGLLTMSRKCICEKPASPDKEAQAQQAPKMNTVTQKQDRMLKTRTEISTHNQGKRKNHK